VIKITLTPVLQERGKQREWENRSGFTAAVLEFNIGNRLDRTFHMGREAFCSGVRIPRYQQACHHQMGL